VISLHTEQVLNLHNYLLSDAYLLLQLLIIWWLCYLLIKHTRAIHMYVLEECIYITGFETLSYCNCIMCSVKSLLMLGIDTVLDDMLLSSQH
jgi:hypothetical protein